MGFPYGELSNGESQEGEPDISLILVQSMGKPRFAWFQFQSHAL